MRAVGDYGSAGQAINWALDVMTDGDVEVAAFLKCWRMGALEEWPDFLAWLDQQPADKT